MLAILPLAVLLPGCDMTVVVKGMLGKDEILMGSLTHYSDGGTVELYGGPHTHCVGNFTYRLVEKIRGGQGTLVCDDRRIGPFRFVLRDMRHGAGEGVLNGVPYSFTF